MSYIINLLAPPVPCGCKASSWVDVVRQYSSFHFTHTLQRQIHIACRLSGKAAFGLGNAQHAIASYRQAIKLNAGGAPAWMGLAEVAESGTDANLAIEAYEHLVRHGKGDHLLHVPDGSLLLISTRGSAMHELMCCPHR
jgi:Tetratricopeptide repeat